MIYAITAIAIVLAGVVIWLLVRGPGENTKAEIEHAGDHAVAVAHDDAKKIHDMPIADLQHRVDELRERGRSGQ